MKNGVFGVFFVIPLLLLGAQTAGAATGVTVPTITTVAGGDGGPGAATSVAMAPCGVATSAGNAYVAEGGVVWALNESNDQLAPFAGEGPGVPGTGAEGQPALTASTNTCSPATDHYGNLLLPSVSTHRVRVVATSTGSFYGQSMTAGDIYTIAGGGTSTADGVPALQATLTSPGAVAVDAAGNIVISDTGTHLIRVVALTSGTYYGQAMTAGDIYTVYSGASGIATDAVADNQGNLVFFASDLAVKVLAESDGTFYGQPMTAGNVYQLASFGRYRPVIQLAVDGAGNVLMNVQHPNFNYPMSLVQVLAAKAGTFYGQSLTAGQIATVAGGGRSETDGGPALLAGLWSTGVTADGSGNLVIADERNGWVRVVAVTNGTFYGKAMTAGDIYTVAGTGNSSQIGNTRPYSGDGGPAPVAEMYKPGSIAVDASGNVLIADTGNDAIRVLAGKTGTFYGLAMTQGDIYSITLGTSKVIYDPTAVAVDAAGNIVIAAGNQGEVLAERSGLYYGQQMTAGNLYSLTLPVPVSTLAVDRSGNLVVGMNTASPATISVFAVKNGTFYGQPMVADRTYKVVGYANSAYCYQNLTGVPGADAGICGAIGVAVDTAGNMVFSDAGNDMVRVLAATSATFYGQPMQAGYVYAVAGTGVPGSTGNGGPGGSAALRGPSAVTHDASGNLIIADSGNNQIRVVALTSGTFYGQAMTAGDIYRIGGTGVPDCAGDGGPATSAGIAAPAALAMLGSGILVAGDNRVRLIG